MNLLESLLDALVRLNGHALVLHVGDKPYVVTTMEAANEFRGPLDWGHVELSTRILTFDAVNRMLGHMLPAEQRAALDEYGATEFEVTSTAAHGERFTMVVAKGGEDVWVEVRRQAIAHPSAVAMTSPAPGADREAVPGDATAPAAEHVPEAVAQLDDSQVSGTPDASDLAQGEIPDAAAVTPDETGHMDDVSDDEDDVSDDQSHHAPWVPLASLEQAAPEHIGEAPFELVHEDPALADSVAVVGMDEEPRQEPADSPAHGSGPAEGEFLLSPSEMLVVQDAVADEQEWDEEVMTETELNDLLAASSSPAPVPDLPSGGDADSPPDDWPAAWDLSASGMADESMFTLEPAFDFTAYDLSQAVEAVAPAGPAAEPLVEAGSVVAARESPAAAEATPAAEASQPSLPEPGSGEPPVPDIVFEPEQQDAEAGTVASGGSGPEAPVLPEAGEDVTRVRPPAIVVPLARPSRIDESQEGREAAAGMLQRVLQLAAARGAATVYIVAQSPPLSRIDGAFSPLEGEPALTAAFVDRLIGEIAPRPRDGSVASTEWIAEVAEIGRVRCVSFRDHRGPGLICRMVTPRAIAADRLGLPAEVQALCSEADGLVLVGGGRESGRSTLLTSFVDLINRSRSDHVISIESQIEYLHDNQRSFISQREVRGDGDALAAAVRAAMREEPDVLVIEELRTPELVWLALDAADSGRLVFGSVPSVAAVSVIERVIEMCPAERREEAQASLAGALRGVVSQVLLRRLAGGRIAAREILLNTPAVATLILEGKTSQLAAALEDGRRSGMLPFAESLASLVRDGVVHPAHAWRKAPHREQFLAALRRDGLDTVLAERLG